MTQRVWTRAGVLELLANLLVIAVAPLVSRLVFPFVDGPLRGLGFGSLLDALSGNGGFTDIGIEVAGAHGLVDRAYSLYDSAVTLDPLLGMGGYDIGPHTHPPTSTVIWLPLTLVDYDWWLSFFVVASACAIALAMRVMRVPAWLAYPLAVAICLTPTGALSTVSTYPLSALALALAWTYRTHPVIAGASYAFLAASRGIAGVLLLYPLVKRQWRTLLLAIAILTGLLLVAVAFEPTVIHEFLTTGKRAIDTNVARLDSFTPQTLLARRGLPAWLVWLGAAVVAGYAFLRRRDVFWPTVWFTFAITPIAWAPSTIAALPLLVVMWRSGRLGRVLTLAVGFATGAIFPASFGLGMASWTFMVVMSGIAIIACPLEPDSPEEAQPVPADKSDAPTTAGSPGA